MLMRRLARPLLASIFIYGGIKELRNVSNHAQAVNHLVEQTAGQIDETLPDQLPADTETLARVDGVVKVGAGAMLALGKFPRFSSLLLAANVVPTTVAAHAFWEHEDAETRAGELIQFLKNSAVFGGLLVSAADTAGRPSVGYRARHKARKVKEQTEGGAHAGKKCGRKQPQKKKKKARQ